MSLHCLYKSVDSPVAEALPRELADGDVVLLLGDAVVMARPGTAWLDRTGTTEVYALDEDLLASGITETDPRVKVIDYTGWLALAEAQPNQRLWR